MNTIFETRNKYLLSHVLYMVVVAICYAYLEKTNDVMPSRLFAVSVIYVGGLFWIYFFYIKKEFLILTFFIIYFMLTFFIPVFFPIGNSDSFFWSASLFYFAIFVFLYLYTYQKK